MSEGVDFVLEGTLKSVKMQAHGGVNVMKDIELQQEAKEWLKKRDNEAIEWIVTVEKTFVLGFVILVTMLALGLCLAVR